MKRFSTISALSLVLLSLFIEACEPKDKDLIKDFAKEWGKIHGLYNEDGSLTGKAIGRGLAPAWLKPDVVNSQTGEPDPAGNAAVDAGKVINSIVDNDKIADEAMDALKKKNSEEALKKINLAIGARPNDWYYRNRRAAIYAETGQDAKATQEFAAAMELCNDNIHCLDAVANDRANLLGIDTVE